MDDSRKQMSATKSSGTGTSNNSDDSCKCPSKSKENDSDVDVSTNCNEGIVDANDAGSQSVVLPKKSATIKRMKRRKTRITLQATMNLNR